MAKVYADKKFKNYTEPKEFAIPVEMKNNPISGDAEYFNRIVERGERPSGDDATLTESTGDFFGDESQSMNEETQTSVIDTNTKVIPNKEDSPKEEPKKEEKKTTTPPAIVDDKKAGSKPKEGKPKPKDPVNNDFN
jgi:hypothetical protein